MATKKFLLQVICMFIHAKMKLFATYGELPPQLSVDTVFRILNPLTKKTQKLQGWACTLRRVHLSRIFDLFSSKKQTYVLLCQLLKKMHLWFSFKGELYSALSQVGAFTTSYSIFVFIYSISISFSFNFISFWRCFMQFGAKRRDSSFRFLFIKRSSSEKRIHFSLG